jgi:5'-3' exonuclease
MASLLIDLSSLWYPAWHSTADQEVSAAFERTVGKVHQLASGHDHVAVCCDAPPYLRGELLPAYKQHRASLPPQAIEQFTRTKERLVADGFLLWSARGFEADDVIATAVAGLRGKGPVVIASGDKDLMTLVSDAHGVSVFSPQSGVTYTDEKVLEKFGCHPAQLADMLALWGDASDNIPGIPGVGPKTAAKLLLEFGTLEGVLTHFDDIPGVLGQRVKEHAPAARLARKVIELRADVPIDVAEIFKERKAAKLTDDGLEGDGISDDVLAPVGSPPGADAVEEHRPEAPKADALAKSAATQMLATLETDSFEHGLEPGTLDAAWQLARGMHNSRLYQKFPTPQACWAAIIRGREMGIGALTALDCFHVIEGKPALHAHLIVARAKAHPDCEFFQLVSSDGEAAEYVTKHRRNPEPTRMRYTLEQAKVAGLCPEKPRLRNPSPGEKDRRGNWEKRPEEMLRKTAAVQLARVEYPDAAMGLYAIEELTDQGD